MPVHIYEIRIYIGICYQDLPREGLKHLQRDLHVEVPYYLLIQLTINTFLNDIF